MKQSANAHAVVQSFTRQSKQFEKGALHFSDKDYLDFMVSCLHPSKSDRVLEVAAGACDCGLALAPFVQHVTCLDMTPDMLAVGKKIAAKRALDNVAFVVGDAQALPFSNAQFDLVLSRLAFHHFLDIESAFEQMTRVLKPDGTLVLIDMVATDDAWRGTRDALETLRDPSHVRNLSKKEMLALFSTHSVDVQTCKQTIKQTSLHQWLAFTQPPVAVQQELLRRFERECQGGEKTGFYPYQTDNGICFTQTWLLLMGHKRPQHI